MRQQVCKNKSWKKRVAAAGMAICMACTMPFSVQAENVTEEYNVQEDYSTESAAENISDEKSEVQSYDIETAKTVNQEDSAAQEPSKEEVQLSLQLVAVEETDTTTLNLTLEEADKLSGKIKVKDNKVIEVTDGEGLILLSNVKPEDYADYAIELITTTGWDLTKPVKVGGKTSTDGTTDISGTEYSFLGLGSENNPYAGTFRLDQGTAATQYSIATSRSLFNALSTKAKLGTIPFCISESTPSMQEPLLAGKLKQGEANKCLTGEIVLRDLNADKVSNAVIGSLIGTMEEGTSAALTFENQFTKELTIRTSSHTGLFCNTMDKNTSLTAELKKASGAGSIKVEATEAGMDAGGFVGHMEPGAGLIIAGSSVDQVTSDSGNAGGLVGSATDGSIQRKEQTTAFSFADTLTVKAGSTSAAGGLIGSQFVTKGEVVSCDLSNYQFKKLVISGGKDVGGLVGVLKNTSTEKTAISISANTATTVTSEVSGAVTNFGGIIGTYQSEQMNNTLTIKGKSGNAISVSTSGGANVSTSYGGIIGAISGSSYVEIENVSVTTSDMKKDPKASFGGLIGKMNDGLLNVGDVTLISSNDSDLSSDADNVDGRGGLVGHLVKGVLRMHGATDLSGQRITTAYHHVGQIVGNNDDGLVYALGNGNGLNADGSGWSLTRYTGADRGGSDIGNWGAVIRLGDQLSEGSNGVFTFDQDAHTVQVHNGNGSELGSANTFAAYVLAFDLSKAYTGGSSTTLSFATPINAAASQKVTLTGDIDLTGTGILGIGKDNGVSGQKFQGTLEGSSHTITLDIGTTYGANVSGTEDNAAGQLYAKRSDQRDAHYSLALIPFAGDVTIQNLTIAGTVACRVPQNVNEEEKSDDIRYPAFVSAAIGLAGGTTAFKNVTVNTKVSVAEEAVAEKAVAQKLHVWQAGFLGRCESKALSFQNCTWGSDSTLTDKRTTENQRIGGLAAEVMGGCEVSVDVCTLSGSITSKSDSNAKVGGLIAVSRGETQNGSSNSYTSADTTIKISNLQVKEENINTNGANTTSGGLLGYQWKNTNVVFAASADNTASESGVMISRATLNADAQFGGLVYQATGYWNATAANSIIFEKENATTTFNGKSTKNAPSGLLVGTGLIKVAQSENVESALYLEAGTWGAAADAAYKINSGAVTLNIGDSKYFDELVGITKFNDAGNSNAVVSLAVRENNGNAAKIDTDENLNTYTGQINKTNYKNGQTRYYYNLDSYRKNNPALNLDSVSTPENLVLWSVAQYAAPNIRGCFRQGEKTDVTITGKIDLKGYSYYPVTPIGAVNLGTNQGNTITSLNFDYDGMNKKEIGNKTLSDSEHQHYLMQHGLFYNAYRNIAVKNTSFSGTVGKEPTEKGGTIYNSGALIYGSVVGDPVNYIVKITLNKVTLAGIRVTDVEKNVTYAPLLINQMEKAVKLTVDTLSTDKGYTTENNSDKTVYAATSLIGNVGSNTATKLTLSFSNIALDGRIAADTANATSVHNNGNVQVEYNTTHTIFTNATLLEYFMYSSEGSGTYNFNSTDKMVTYGVELTNAGSIGRNPDKQYQYYDGEIYITDEQQRNEVNEDYVKERYKDTNFIRYVHTQQNINANQYELDINQKTSGLLKGCGTYGDPYIIEDAHQLSSLAAYIEKPESVKKFQAVFNSKVLNEKKQTAESYHLQGGATSDTTYTWENGVWINGTAGSEKIETDTATKYLLNAYYKINNDITLSAESFSGLGTKDNPFSGVIVGTNSTTEVKIIGTNSNKDSFGGLIAYSRGSVVKDLKVDYASATITMQADTLPGTTKNPFFGGVVGYCMGGDTIFDNVSVNYGADSVTFSGTYEYMIAAGGYVGLVGGATHVTEETDYEKTGGGVVFRNMEGTSNTFTTACEAAAAANKTVNMVKADGTADGKSASNGGNYFYRNPYVGRVLDGYACAEGCTVNNTDKNYTIPTLTAGTNDLDANGSLNVTVTSAQGLWLLSAIVNSGAGAMDSDGSYTDVDNQVVDAYQYGKPRTASYEGIGTATVAANLTDEAYWGGIASESNTDEAKNRVSYLVKNYTTGTTAAHLAGKSSTAVNNPVSLTFKANSIDMRSYGNGFRGIGSSYGNNKHVWNKDCSIPEVYRRNLLIKSINADQAADTVITLNMNQNDYHTEYSNGAWQNQGAGLFVDFHFTDECEVMNLEISGSVQLGLFEGKNESNLGSNLTYVTKRNDEKQIGVGGFAARTANCKGKVTFSNFALKNTYIYGGTMTGGAIGYIDGYDQNDPRNVTFKNWSFDTGNIMRWTNNADCTGGLVGWYNGYGILEIVGDETKQNTINIKDISVMTVAMERKQASSGGIVGASDYGSVNLKNITAQTMTVTGENLRSLGGLIGDGRNSGQFNLENCTLNNITVKSNKNSENIGGVIGYHDKITTIQEVTITEKSLVYGQQFVGGFVGNSSTTKNGTLKIKKCKETDTNIQAEWNWAGGFIGYLSANRTAMFQECRESNVNILGRYVGGLIGAIDGNITASNIEFNTVKVITRAGSGGRSAGLLTGNSANLDRYSNKVLGYNIIAKDCKAGYSNVIDFNKLATAPIQPLNTTGLWLGQNGKTTTTNLTAVSAGGDIFPQKDIGTQSGIATIIYTDKTADQTYQPTESTAKPSPSEAPWVDVNPKSDVQFADGTVMTGNGVGMSKDGMPVAKSILQRFSSTDADRYWNLTESDDSADVTYRRFSQFLDTSNEAYITTYRTEESETTEISADIDFPVLVVNNSAEVDTMLWNYIAAMTNVSSGDIAKTQIKSITATSYKWDNTAKNFKAQESASLKVSETNKITIVPNAYDNQNSQFTLLDVTYEDPTDSTHAFHLYIPVLVKKVLYINFKTRFIAGTDYCASDYPMTDTSPNHYATAGFNEPVTAYMEYRYEKETDWQSMLDNGENLLWHYDKILDLASGSTSVVGTTLLPAGTRLTLVDRQTMQYYTYTTTGTEDFHKFKLTDMTAPGTDSAGKTSPFAPVFICDLLELKAEEASNQTDGATYYVQETDPSKATVRVGADYYRKATDEEVKDSKVTKYKITVPSENGKPIVKERTESYYLTIQIPDTNDLSIVNNRLYAATMSRKEGTLPAVIKSDKTTDSSAYVVYNGVQQSLTISTNRIHNGADTGDTAMENGDGIKISLTGKLWLTEAGKSQFQSLGPSEVYHEFDVSLKKYLKEAVGISDVVGTENITYTYTVAKSDNKSIVTKEGRLSGIAGKDTLTLQYGSADLKRALELAETENSAVTVTAVITLTYDGADKFPVRDTAVTSDNSGTSVVGVSRIANTSTQLPITENKKTEENKNRYYVTNPSKAKLTYSSVNVDPNVTSDTTQQLGVNPLDMVNNRSDMIYTRADYDYSNVDAAVLNKANKIRYKMELFQKNETGSYDETKPLPIKDYLQNTVKENGSTEAPLAGSSETSGTGTVYQWEENFELDDGRHQIARFQYAPLTGEAFERKNYTYANYRVRLTAVLLDEKGNELDGTKATDYIIYTNARISQEIMQQQQ